MVFNYRRGIQRTVRPIARRGGRRRADRIPRTLRDEKGIDLS